ncbi:hypothetical protein [Salinarimonas ramus]|uniref:Uncharacterized protein n=1 Tax=Salinarimonas ramus TaxID=690164 RepID=A0A917QJZ3_9HYPH|nr:hypothetical protein [Salinarimonas ramus]GGK52824.1 hypothetical protein GCM10011322_44650 [Salinarimonas ramus]
MITLLLAIICWQMFCIAFDVREPWDAPAFWSVAYPASIAMSAVAGYLARSGWIVGLVVTFAQLPIIVVSNGLDATNLFAVAILAALSLPPAVAAASAARLAENKR